MGISSFGSLNIAMSGLTAAQRALDITGHNIANVNTEGYSRQEVQFASRVYSPTSFSSAGAPGRGVDVEAYRRIRDNVIEQYIYDETGNQGTFNTLQKGLEEIELSFPEPSDRGLRSLMDKMWSSFQNLANQPTSAAARQSVINQAQALTEAFRTTHNDLGVIAGRATSEIATDLVEVNDIADKLANLNRDIKGAYVVGDDPNELLDQRDSLIDRLSALGTTKITRQSSGAIDVDFGGFALVSDVTAAPVTEPDLTVLTSGRIHGLQQLRDVTAPSYQSKLDALAESLLNEFNTQHQAGFDANGVAGVAFFTGTGAADIQLNAAVAADSKLVAASDDGTSGRGANALALANFKDAANTVSGTTSINEGYRQMINDLGSETREMNRRVLNQNALVQNLRDRRDSVAGVSLDEEMSNLVRFQRSFEASARALNTMDDMLDRLINRTGRVGL